MSEEFKEIHILIPHTEDGNQLDTVNFFVENLDVVGSSMLADFHLPFQSIAVYLRKIYKVGNIPVDQFLFIEDFHAKAFSIVTTREELGQIFFRILDTGEIEIKNISFEDIKENKEYTKSTKDLNVLIANDDLFIKTHDKHLYNFIYEAISLIDDLNNSKYVVTKHTTSKVTGKQYSDGFIEKRIKIKSRRLNYVYDENKKREGTKHRYKYRVRGHWHHYHGIRKWTLDYVRGGNGTIFIPKEYELLPDENYDIINESKS